MADAPAAVDALARVRADLQRQQDVIDDLVSKLADARAIKAQLIAVRDDYVNYIAFKAAQP